MTFVEYVIITLFALSLIGAFAFRRMTMLTPVDSGPFRVDASHEPLLDSMPTLTGSHVLVRPALGIDGAPLRATIDDEVVQWMGWTDAHVADLSTWSTSTKQALRQAGYLTVVDKSVDQVVGAIVLGGVDIVRGTAELGMWLGPTARGRGYAREALELGLQAFGAVGLGTVRIVTAENNKRMRRIAEQVGALPMLGVEHTLPNGEQVDGVIYAVGGGQPLTRSAPTRSRG